MTKDPVIHVLSAGAPKTGVRKCLESYRALAGQVCTIEFATAPVIEEQVMSGKSTADIVVAPLSKLETFAGSNRVAADSITAIGSIVAGVVVRDGRPDPDLSTVATLVAAIRNADGLVYNQASSGQYIAAMIDELGLAEAVRSKTIRVPTGAAVMEHVAGRTDNVIGFGQMTEIRLYEKLGIHPAGPLPAPVSKETEYAVGISTTAANRRSAAGVLTFMDSEEGRRIFSETGVERH